MGLAASQCRLLFITSRQNDVSAKMQRISNDRLILSRDEDDISTKYNRMLSATKYVNADDTDISYNSIMGSNAALQGNFGVIQSANGAVVLNKDLANKKFNLPTESGDGNAFKQHFGNDITNFIKQAEGSNAGNVIAKLSSGDDGSNPPQVEEATWVGHWRYACEHDSNILNLGQYKFDHNPTVSDMLTNLGGASYTVTSDSNWIDDYNNGTSGNVNDFSYDENKSVTISDLSNQINGNSVLLIGVDGCTGTNARDNAKTNASMILKDFANKMGDKIGIDNAESRVQTFISNVKSLIDEADGKHTGCGTANKAKAHAHNDAKNGLIGHGSFGVNDYFCMNVGEALRRTAILIANADANAVAAVNNKDNYSYDTNASYQVAKPAGSSQISGEKVNDKGYSKTTFESKLKDVYNWYVWSDEQNNSDDRHFPAGESTMSWENALKVFNGETIPVESNDSSSSGLVEPSSEQANQNLANYYIKLWDALSRCGWSTQSNETIQANLNQGLYYINGTQISESDNYVPKKDQDAIDKAERWYEQETKKIKRKEDQMDRDLTKYQTEYSALTNDYNSVKSIIDANVQKSFTYCQNG